MKVRTSLPLGTIIGVLAVLILAASTWAAAPTQLRNGTVTPLSGTTATIFQFSVRFQSGTTTGNTVTASVAGASHALVWTGGTDGNEIWTGSSTLPAGSWTVTFSAVSSSGPSPDPISFGPVVVTAPTPAPTPTPPPPPPTATPRPTTAPTPRPLPTATPRPGTTAQPNASATPFGTTIDPTGSPLGSVANTADASASPTPSSSPASTPPAKRPLNVPVEGVVAIGLLGAVAFAAIFGERRRRMAVEAFRARATATERTVGAGAFASGASADWEPDVPDEMVGTIDYETPADLVEEADEPVDEPDESHD